MIIIQIDKQIKINNKSYFIYLINQRILKMEIQLRQYILSQKLSDKLIQNNHKESQWLSINNQYNKHEQKIKNIKQYMMIIGIIIFLSYKIFYQGQNSTCLTDLLQDATAAINYQLNNNKAFYNISAIITQQIIEVQLLFLIYLSIFKAKNLRIHLFICFFYGLRAIYLNIQKIPFPQGFVSYEPDFPCFSVPYGITRDFYYSGHTGIMLFSVIEANRMEMKMISRINLFLTLVIIFFLVCTRVHYTIDIFGSIIFTLWIDRYLSSKYIYFDKLWSLFYRGFKLISSKCASKYNIKIQQ